jgi:hypothetical protein
MRYRDNNYRSRADGFPIFAEKSLSDLFKRQQKALETEIQSQNENYLLNVNEATFIDYLVSKYSIHDLEIDFDAAYAVDSEEMVPASQFPSNFSVRDYQSYPVTVLTYRIPFVGNSELLKCEPSNRLIWTTEVFLSGDEICFSLRLFSNDSLSANSVSNGIIVNIKKQLQNISNEISTLNSGLLQNASRVFKSRKEKLLAKNNLLGQLNVPIKRRDSLPATFAIPTPEIRKPIKLKPATTDAAYKPEPSLDQEVFVSILKIIHDLGKMLERMPSLYKNKLEEELRDHLVMYLEPRFDGSTTGETFNKTGKTDILIRYQNSNVFVAECKFWGGKKLYLNTISQLLHYLTWRDSKAAVIMFVRNLDFSSVLDTVEKETLIHSNYLGFVSKNDESWFNYRFHMDGDTNREIQLAVLLIHMPPIEAKEDLE